MSKTSYRGLTNRLAKMKEGAFAFFPVKRGSDAYHDQICILVAANRLKKLPAYKGRKYSTMFVPENNEFCVYRVL